jgi:hypothetical protein
VILIVKTDSDDFPRSDRARQTHAREGNCVAFAPQRSDKRERLVACFQQGKSRGECFRVLAGGIDRLPDIDNSICHHHAETTFALHSVLNEPQS